MIPPVQVGICGNVATPDTLTPWCELPYGHRGWHQARVYPVGVLSTGTLTHWGKTWTDGASE